MGKENGICTVDKLMKLVAFMNLSIQNIQQKIDTDLPVTDDDFNTLLSAWDLTSEELIGLLDESNASLSVGSNISLTV